MSKAIKVRVKGVVQGVGFRPFIYLLAREHSLKGWVLNDEAGVEIHLEGDSSKLEKFLEELPLKAPRASRLDEVSSKNCRLEGIAEFEIVESRQGKNIVTRISPDMVVCDSCLDDLGNEDDQHYEYPYVNCTHCGPRYSIIKSLPYDRTATTMADWPMCDHCKTAYDNPENRRFHAQPVACPRCGPDYYLTRDGVEEHPNALSLTGRAAIKKAASLIKEGKIVAIKGIGGYHLAVDAANDEALTLLRERKYRKEKPFALMMESLELAREFVYLNREQEEALTSIARPIVLCRSRTTEKQSGGSRQSALNIDLLAPGNLDLGLMLPYTPLHHLLFQYGCPGVLVLTSANRSSEPIAYTDEDAFRDLADIADAYLVGERPIARRVDDSIVCTSSCGPHILRRARGYAPDVVAKMPYSEPVLALGADLKNTVALVVNGQAIVSQHIGDLEHLSCYEAFEETIRDLTSMYGIGIGDGDGDGFELGFGDLTVVHDRHPQYRSTQYAESLSQAKSVIGIQHHQAHVASVLAEHEMFEEPVLGIAFDGTGWGDDGSIWGGEFFTGSIADGFERCASILPTSMPGGDAAAMSPTQAAAGFLWTCLDDSKDTEDAIKAARQFPNDLELFCQTPFDFSSRFKKALSLLDKNVQCWKSTSVGRLFDAAAAIAGFNGDITYEAQAAVWFEHKGRRATGGAYYDFRFDSDQNVLDWRGAIRSMVEERIKGASEVEIAGAFHLGLARGMAEAASYLCSNHGLSTVAVSGGVMQNMLLMDLFAGECKGRGLKLIANHKVPANDGGISLGQAALAFSMRSKKNS